MRQYVLLSSAGVSITPLMGKRGARLMSHRYNAAAYTIGYQKAGQATLSLFCGEGTKQMNVSVSSLREHGAHL